MQNRGQQRQAHSLWSALILLYDLPEECYNSLSATNTSSTIRVAGATCSYCRELSCSESHSKLDYPETRSALHVPKWNMLPLKPLEAHQDHVSFFAADSTKCSNLPLTFKWISHVLQNFGLDTPIILTMSLNFLQDWSPTICHTYCLNKASRVFPNARSADPISKVSWTNMMIWVYKDEQVHPDFITIGEWI